MIIRQVLQEGVVVIDESTLPVPVADSINELVLAHATQYGQEPLAITIMQDGTLVAA